MIKFCRELWQAIKDGLFPKTKADLLIEQLQGLDQNTSANYLQLEKIYKELHNYHSEQFRESTNEYDRKFNLDKSHYYGLCYKIFLNRQGKSVAGSEF